jgi:hypothetical protein
MFSQQHYRNGKVDRFRRALSEYLPDWTTFEPVGSCRMSCGSTLSVTTLPGLHQALKGRTHLEFLQLYRRIT